MENSLVSDEINEILSYSLDEQVNSCPHFELSNRYVVNILFS